MYVFHYYLRYGELCMRGEHTYDIQSPSDSWSFFSGISPTCSVTILVSFDAYCSGAGTRMDPAQLKYM